MSTSRLLAAGLALLVPVGCARPMGSTDGIFPDAGVAPRHNVAIQTADPFAGQRPIPNPGGDGQRAATIIERYRSGAPTLPVQDNAPPDGAPR